MLTTNVADFAFLQNIYSFVYKFVSTESEIFKLCLTDAKNHRCALPSIIIVSPVITPFKPASPGQPINGG